MSEQVPYAAREKRLPETATKIVAILEEGGYLVGELEVVFDQVRMAVNRMRVTQQ
ncbi:MAG: hypothetical protein HY794_13495 [Desulfarculus sp.]|nr:hypothetical protein [Desulfarculus sp.]